MDLCVLCDSKCWKTFITEDTENTEGKEENLYYGDA